MTTKHRRRTELLIALLIVATAAIVRVCYSVGHTPIGTIKVSTAQPVPIVKTDSLPDSVKATKRQKKEKKKAGKKFPALRQPLDEPVPSEIR